MDDIWRVLGYDKTAERIAEELRRGDKICLLEGPPGVGKSWLAMDIAAFWEQAGGSVVVAEGDSLRADAPLYPFAFAMGGPPSRMKTIGPAIAGVARAGEAFLGTAGLITSTVEVLVRAGTSGRRTRTMFLGDTEQGILHDLSRLGKKRPMLIVADNLHWWDSRSLELLGRLLDRRMWEAFPFLNELRILAVETSEPDQSVSTPEAHDALLAPSATSRFPLPRVPREGFEDVLASLGAEPRPSKAVTDVVYSLSGGHLALASRCAARIAEDDGASFLAASNTEQFIRALLSERIKSLGPPGQKAIAMLQVAAILGLTFSRQEVCCGVGADDAETRRLLRYCRGEGLIEVADGLDRFVHDLYRQHFLNLAASQTTDIHEKLSDCLRVLRPAEYELRCLNEVGADRQSEAAALAVHAALQYTRDGREWRELPPGILSVMSAGELTTTAERLVGALEDLNRYRFDDCLARLESLPHRSPRSLTAEADYLRAMCLMSTRSEQDRARGRSILEGWSGYEDEEPELGTRLMLLLLYGLCHILDKTAGWALERQISRALSARANFDVAAEDALYTLDRCAGGLHPPDAALVRTREAAAHFGASGTDGILRRPVEYYRCMVNYGAKLIENARYDDASHVCESVESLIDSFSPGVFPRIDYPYMNGVLAQFRLGAVDANEAVLRQRKIAAQQSVASDPFYVQNALAVYLALSGDPAQAVEIFNGLEAELARSRTSPEPSMSYLIGVNRCAARFVAGSDRDLTREWNALGDLARQSNYTDRDVLTLRHELLCEVIDARQPMTAREFDEYLLDTHPDRLGPLWRNYAHGFVMPAIEFWREN